MRTKQRFSVSFWTALRQFEMVLGRFHRFLLFIVVFNCVNVQICSMKNCLHILVCNLFYIHPIGIINFINNGFVSILGVLKTFFFKTSMACWFQIFCANRRERLRTQERGLAGHVDTLVGLSRKLHIERAATSCLLLIINNYVLVRLKR